jgi:hypothetical protein
VEIVVEVTPELARLLRDEPEAFGRHDDVLGLPEITLEPLHPGVEDPEFARYFVAQLPDEATVEDAIRRLRERAGVVSAYVKPGGEPP